MDGPTRTTTTSSTFHSLPVNEDATTSDHAHLALIPSSSSRASSVALNEQDAYAQLQPSVHTHGWEPETTQPTVLLALAFRLRPPRRAARDSRPAARDSRPKERRRRCTLPCRRSSRHSPTHLLCALYLPTITAALYNLAWNWVDLDVKRIAALAAALPARGRHGTGPRSSLD